MLLNIGHLTINAIQQSNMHPLCRDINFSVNHGETVGILGESGSGKSITALSILRLLPPTIEITKGEITFVKKNGSNINIAKAPAKDLQSIRGKEISIIFQEPMTSLNPVFTCGDQVFEAIRKHQDISGKEAKELAIALFDKVKLPNPRLIYNKYPYQLSGGQKQRVMIAMAISCNPSLLIADEPTTALDVTVQKSILDLLKELQADMGMSIIFITHDINVIAEIAQKILVFYKGEIVEQGLVNTILNHPLHPYTKGLLGCRMSISTKGRRLNTLETFEIPMDTKETGTQEQKYNSPSVNPELKTNHENIPLLSIRDLNVSFQQSNQFLGPHSKKQILHNIYLDVYQGETLGLVGESGSGKTTIGRSIMKLIGTESGEILFHGQQANQLTGKKLQDYRKKVQIIFQDPYSSLNPKMTIGEMIAEPLKVHNLYKKTKEREKRVKELLRLVNLKEEYYHRYPHQFSGGQRQRIGIARILAVEPELIILDESVSALDVSIQAQVLNLLNDLKQWYGLTYIFISHDLNTVRYMADRIIVLHKGKIVEEGEAEALFSSPKNPYTVGLINAIPGKSII